ncbi:MAG: hypothetical protein Q8R33_15545 [Burkholderiales bacterium]|nr:hypothetical protein [Burkholderiales bacterium]
MKGTDTTAELQNKILGASMLITEILLMLTDRLTPDQVAAVHAGMDSATEAPIATLEIKASGPVFALWAYIGGEPTLVLEHTSEPLRQRAAAAGRAGTS